ncbi:hypothetical protein [Desulfothermobacter acidiphilus]|uniref:hypothetical protein n=1 Tax=Desulfothermobacter acidiphilus TaxID=1938353 RepID=UPI003F8CB02C
MKRVREEVVRKIRTLSEKEREKVQEIYLHQGAKKARAYLFRRHNIKARAAEVRRALHIKKDNSYNVHKALCKLAWAAAGWRTQAWYKQNTTVKDALVQAELLKFNKTAGALERPVVH